LRDVTHVTSAARPFHVILHVSWLDKSQQRSSLHIKTLIYYAYVANVSKHAKNYVVFETH